MNARDIYFFIQDVASHAARDGLMSLPPYARLCARRDPLQINTARRLNPYVSAVYAALHKSVRYGVSDRSRYGDR